MIFPSPLHNLIFFPNRLDKLPLPRGAIWNFIHPCLVRKPSYMKEFVYYIFIYIKINLKIALSKHGGGIIFINIYTSARNMAESSNRP